MSRPSVYIAKRKIPAVGNDHVAFVHLLKIYQSVMVVIMTAVVMMVMMVMMVMVMLELYPLSRPP